MKILVVGFVITFRYIAAANNVMSNLKTLLSVSVLFVCLIQSSHDDADMTRITCKHLSVTAVTKQRSSASWTSQGFLGIRGPKAERPPFSELREQNSDSWVEGNTIAKQVSEAAQPDLRYVYRSFATCILALGAYYREICLGNVYFNARFDDVMLIVKREMASVLRGPLRATLWDCTMNICFRCPYRKDYIYISRPGKSGFVLIHLFCMVNDQLCSFLGGRTVCLLVELTSS